MHQVSLKTTTRPQPLQSAPVKRKAHTASAEAPALRDIQINFPGGLRFQIRSASLFADPYSEAVRTFISRVFRSPEVQSIEIDGTAGTAEIAFVSLDGTSGRRLIQRIGRALAAEEHAQDAVVDLYIPPAPLSAQDARLISVYRYGSVISTWAVRHQTPGRLRFRNPSIYRKKDICQAIERELMSVPGIERYKTNELTSTVLVHYNPRAIRKRQIVELLDLVLRREAQEGRTAMDLDLPLATASLALAATAQLAAPALLPVAAGVFVYSTIPSFKAGYEVLFKERRLGVDVLDVIVIGVCLATTQIFAGSVLAWCLSFGRKLVKKTEDDSKKMLLNVFGKQPRFVWLYRDGQEIETALEKLKLGDIIVVNTGETVPVDGEITEGLAMIDQHSLTGESAPAEKAVGDKVFASTTMVAGKIKVAVTSAGSETTSAKLTRILNDTAGYKLRSQSQAEELADKAVIPTLGLAALGLSTIGVNGATAVINCDLGTGIRMAAPLAMLTSLTLCAQHGILVKDGRALELMRKVDTFLFDKTGTLTRERPEVGRVLTFGGYTEAQILTWAAAAEYKFSHPIAKAIISKFESLGLPMAQIDDSKYHVGYGITVSVDGYTVRVGSVRFMKHEGITLPENLSHEIEAVYGEGNSVILVAVDDALGGAIEMCAANRPEVEEVIRGLRERGARHLAIISGDHDRPTRRLAEKLGMDRYFAEVLPQDKARYVELLQKEGRTVCFIGDGINDSIALKRANVSISLRGASSIATDTAQVVFMEESLAKLLQLHDISQSLQRNVDRSWNIIIVPNAICITGAFLFGFGVMHSMIFNQIGAIFALANGLLPLRRVAQAQAELERAATELIVPHDYEDEDDEEAPLHTRAGQGS
ncbi:heavy metal translocating P-type ATPase [Verrucomicrobia bacterium LW23]|nr:heavy metal translocating P-type ATPase [Verrucomicrobia bacterium LW23]